MMTQKEIESLRLQCLVRNSRYQNDLEELEQRLGMPIAVFDRQFHAVWLALYMRTAKEVQQEFPAADLDQVRRGFIELGRFKERWGLLGLPDSQGETGLGDAIEVVGRPEEGQSELPYLNLRVNLSYSKETLQSRFDDLISVSQKIFSSEKKLESLQSPQFYQLHQGLKLFDAIESKGQPFDVAFTEIFPQETGGSQENLETLRQQAKTAVEKIKILIKQADRREDFFASVS